MTTTAPRRLQALPAVLASLAMVVALIYRHALVTWFTGADRPSSAGAVPTARGSAGDPAYYTCAMHPQVHADHPGPCPICGMTMIPVSAGDLAAGVVHVDEQRRGDVGIRTTAAVRAPLALAIRAEARVVVDETRLHDVALKVGGYISQLQVNATGQRVRRGDVLFALFSPELYAAQQDYLLARQHRELAHAAGAPADPPRGDALAQAAETRLKLWGLGDDQIAAIAASGAPIERVPFRSPAGGVVIDKAVVEGDAVTAGQRLFRIADLDRLWVEADLYEGDLMRIARGTPATVTLPYLPGKQLTGAVAFVYPYLDPASRTGRVRIALANPQLELKPEMFATVAFEIALGDRLQIPSTAVIYTGPRRLVFVDLGDGRLQPRDVVIGARGADAVEIVEGLREGDRVVTAGNFLVAAESRVRSTGTFWTESAASPVAAPADKAAGHPDHTSAAPAEGAPGSGGDHAPR